MQKTQNMVLNFFWYLIPTDPKNFDIDPYRLILIKQTVCNASLGQVICPWGGIFSLIPLAGVAYCISSSYLFVLLGWIFNLVFHRLENIRMILSTYWSSTCPTSSVSGLWRLSKARSFCALVSLGAIGDLVSHLLGYLRIILDQRCAFLK